MATAEDGLPNGHAAIDRRVLQCFHKRGFHVLPAQRNTNFPRLSKSFCLEKLFFSRLVAGVDGGKLNQA